MGRRSILDVGLAAALPVNVASAAQAARVEAWKDPTCGCCDGLVRHMRAAGFEATVQDTPDLHAIKSAVASNCRQQSASQARCADLDHYPGLC